MSKGATIERTAYNSNQSQAVQILGLGSGNTGYGQLNLSSPAASGQVITASIFNNLRSDLSRIWTHQRGSAVQNNDTVGPPNLRLVTTGTVITDILTQYSDFINNSSLGVLNNTDIISASQATSGVSISNTSRVTAWGGATDVISQTVTVTFNGYKSGNISVTSCTSTTFTCASTQGFYVNMPVYFEGTTFGGVSTNTLYYIQSILSSTTFNIKDTVGGSTARTLTPGSGSMTVGLGVDAPNHARCFFNSGGSIQVRASRSGGSASTKNTTWTNMLNGFGTLSFGASTTAITGAVNAGGSVATSSGFRNLTIGGGSITLLSQPGPAGVYAENDYIVQVSRPTSSTLQFVITFRDDDAGDQTGLGAAVDEEVDGTLTSIVECTRPSGANVDVPAPTGSATSIA